MRIRVVKPDFWSDSVLSRLPDGARLFYIGLWMEADDAGWLKWEPREIAAGLYPYRGVRSRERQVEEWFQLLASKGRVILHPCGHAVIPTFGRHQRTGGNRQTRVRDIHLDCQSGQIHTSPDESVRKGREGKVIVREGKEGEIPKGNHLAVVDGKYEAVQ